MTNDLKNQVDVAVFFDFENIVFSVRNNYNINANFEDLMDKCKEFGRVVVARAFADWNRQSSVMIPALISNGFDPVYVPSFHVTQDGKQQLRKNAVDMYMAIDAMDVLHNRKNVNTFILLTGDSDFLPLVNAVRREGNRVIAIGVDGSSSSHLAQAVDEFIFYSQVSSVPGSVDKKRPTDIYEAITKAITKLEEQGKSTVLPNIKMMMAELMGGFDEKKYSDSKGRKFQKFKEFVQESERRGLVKLVTTGTVNEVFLADSEQGKNAAERAAKSKRPEPTTSKSSSSQPPARPATSLLLDDALDLLVAALSKAKEENKSTRASVIKGIMVKLQDGFDEKRIEGKQFSRFGDFVKAAEQKGVIKTTGKGHQKELYLVEQATPVEEPDETVEESDTADYLPDNGEPAESQTNGSAPAAAENLKNLSEREARELIVAGLRSFRPYPTTFLKVEAHCRSVRNDRKVYLSSPKVRELLTDATRSVGLLKRISPAGVSPAQYQFQDDGALIAAYLGDAPMAVAESAAEETSSAEPNHLTPQTAPQTMPQAAPQTAPPSAPEPVGMAEDKLAAAFKLLVQAVKEAKASGKSQRLSAIKQRMGKLDESFDFNALTNADGEPFDHFADFAKVAQAAGKVRLTGSGANTQIMMAN